MSNTRKTRKPDLRAIEMGLKRRQEKLRLRLQQANNEQRAAHARKVSDEKFAEAQKLIAGDAVQQEDPQGTYAWENDGTFHAARSDNG